MTIGQSMLGEFDQEMAGTRKTLERLPEQKWNWKPHDKSMPLGRLATIVATTPGWIEISAAECSGSIADRRGIVR